VARSQDLPAAVLMFSAFIALWFIGPGLWKGLAAIMVAALAPEVAYSTDDLLPFVKAIGSELMRRLGLFLLIVFVATLASQFAQVGLLFTTQPLVPSLSKINPLTGLQRMFSMQSLMRAVINFGKLLLVGAVAWITLAGCSAVITYSFSLGFHDFIQVGAALTHDLGIRLATAMMILALLDLVWQRYRHERDLRMTKEEVKDELRSMEGDPQIRRRRQQLQQQLAAQRLQQDVPGADVVVTNPTHVSVAIRYEAASMPAPKVVAKGGDYLALRIRQIARDHGIPIVERKPLARALFESVEPGEYIPERFYKALAEILAYVYDLTGRVPPAARRELAGV